jgi:hypothetical protein
MFGVYEEGTSESRRIDIESIKEKRIEPQSNG